jgi:hypothetical protein
MSESLRFLGSMDGHKGWVTAIATSSENPDMILSSSRGIYLILPFLLILISDSILAQIRPLLFGH